MYLDIENPVMRYIVHNELRHRYPEVLTTDSLGNSNKVIYNWPKKLTYIRLVVINS